MLDYVVAVSFFPQNQSKDSDGIDRVEDLHEYSR